MHVLEVKDLIRNYQKSSFKKSEDDIKVLKGLNFTVEEGEFVGIMGKSVVVGGAFGAGGIDTVSDFYGFNSADGKKGFPKAGVQFIEDGGAKSGGQSADAAFDDAAGGVLRCHAFLEIGLGFGRSFRICHVEGILQDVGGIKGCGCHRSDGLCVGAKRDAQFFQDFHGDGAGGHAADGFPAGRAAAAPVIPETIFLFEGIIRMSRPV